MSKGEKIAHRGKRTLTKQAMKIIENRGKFENKRRRISIKTLVEADIHVQVITVIECMRVSAHAHSIVSQQLSP